MRIAIAGGGISGLSLAYALLEKNPSLDVQVFEADSRVGGKVFTEKAGGFLCEGGVNGFLDSKPRTLELAAKISLSPLRSNDNARKRFIYTGGRLNRIPESPPAFLSSKLLTPWGKLRVFGELFAAKGTGGDETLESFAVRRLGREVFETLIDPMASGIYAGDPSKLSLKSCFARIYELEQNYGSLIKALITLQRQSKKTGKKVGPGPGGALTSFYGGMGAMTDTLKTLLGGRVQAGRGVKGVEKRGGLYAVHLADGSVHEADRVALAAPAYASAEMLRDLDRGISSLIEDIPYPAVSVVCLGFRQSKVTVDLNGFGFLVPGREKRKILGTLYDSSIFPNRAPEGHVLLRTMVGGARAGETARLDDERLRSTVQAELAALMGLKAEPDFVRIYRWERAIPQYNLGHQERLRALDEALARHHGLYLTGNAYRGIGVNDCVENSFAFAEKIAS